MSETIYRTEKKFLLPDLQLHRLESKVRLLCTPDSHGDAEGRYEVRSLYFDSLDDLCYYECKAGVDNRKKYRIRTYNCSKDIINLECKAGLHGKKHKDVLRISGGGFESILSGGGIAPEGCIITGIPGTEENTGLLSEFDFKLKQGYQPKTVVAYTRTAYIYPAGNVRITIDRDIRALPESAFFDASAGGMRVLAPGREVLEIKYDEVLPQAILDLFAAESNLRHCAFSKYAVCRDVLKGESYCLFE